MRKSDSRPRTKAVTLTLALALAAVVLHGCDEREEAGAMSGPEQTGSDSRPAGAGGDAARHEKATFAAGCFWGVEAAFQGVPGVVSTAVGYTGGTKKDPTYKQVCTGTTGHAEAVQVIYDPAKVSYERLLEVFWGCHDPTTPNRQGPDIGEQYRSAVFPHTPEQAAAAKASKDKHQAAGRFKDPIITEITPASTFWPAEEYHQRYLEKRGQAACHKP